MAPRPPLKARTLAVTRGEKHDAADALGIWFTSTESCAKVLAAGNQELLRIIAAQPPGSLDELARAVVIKATGFLQGGSQTLAGAMEAHAHCAHAKA